MKKLLAVALMAMGLMATGAKADPIGPDCSAGNNSCFGGIYTLEYAVVSPTEYLVRLLIDSSGYTGAATDWIQSVAIKAASSILPTSSLVSTTAPGTWTYHDGGLNSGGCNGAGSGFACADSPDNLALVGATYQWIFDIKVANATDWLLAAGAASIKVNYDPQTGTLVSENITLQNNPNCCNHDTPEPQPLVLVGLGLVVLAAMRRRRAV
jgi:MYXO-CTERM domain-containing protein